MKFKDTKEDVHKIEIAAYTNSMMNDLNIIRNLYPILLTNLDNVLSSEKAFLGMRGIQRLNNHILKSSRWLAKDLKKYLSKIDPSKLKDY